MHLHSTPTHASWLNQVELFFSILERRLLRRGEFASVDELAGRVIAFIKDYNRRAAPFRWTYEGRPLKAAEYRLTCEALDAVDRLLAEKISVYM